tara:strand:+ start:275 stop:649 length:375 start_codon:yes stop_codon:yes gene_type:complete
MNSELNLHYKDGSGYNQNIQVIINGTFTDVQLEMIKSKLNDDKFLIAEQVGLPSPQDEMARNNAFPTEEDHVWSSFPEFDDRTPIASEFSTDLPATSKLTVEELVKTFSTIKWQEQEEMERLGL